MFKTSADPFVGKLSYFRVYGAPLKKDSQLWNAEEEEAEADKDDTNQETETEIEPTSAEATAGGENKEDQVADPAESFGEPPEGSAGSGNR